MSVQRLTRAEWQPYCERISDGIRSGQRVELEIVSLGLGDHVEAKWMPILGLVYEPKTDMFEVALDGIDHTVAHPREVLIETSPRGVVGLEIVAADDVRRIIKFLKPLELPPRRRRTGSQQPA